MRGRYKTLLIDDDEIFIVQLKRLLTNIHEITVARTYEEAKAVIRAQSFDLVFLDKYLPQQRIGITLIPEIKLLIPQAAIIVLTAEKPDESVADAIRAGAFDYLQKTSNLTEELPYRVAVALERLRLEKRLQKVETLAADQLQVEIIGCSDSIRDLKETITTVGANPINVLISGETGTGKELVARALNQITSDRNRPFISINCAAIPHNLVESEFFGHAKGAFTGATHDKPGKFEVANEGDLFLDEVGELPLDVQAKLLRVLQEGEFTRVGCVTVRHSRPRIISATNRDLFQMVAQNKFREDLYYRIAGYEIGTTPLRQRREDIPLLVEHFISKKEGQSIRASEELIHYFRTLSWPGNIRELNNKIDAALIFTKKRNGSEVSLNDFLQSREKVREVKTRLQERILVSKPNRKLQYTAGEYKSEMESAEKTYLLGALDFFQWNLDLAAHRLGISKAKIYQRISAYNLKLFKHQDWGNRTYETE